VTATIFLIQTLFGFYILAVMLRFLLQCVRADFYNPLVQFLVRITNPLLLPLRRIVPGYKGLDVASLVLAFVLQFLEVLLVTLLVGRDAGIGGLILIAAGELFKLLINISVQAADQYLLVGADHSGHPELGQPRSLPSGGALAGPTDRALAAAGPTLAPADRGSGFIAHAGDRGADFHQLAAPGFTRLVGRSALKPWRSTATAGRARI